jgi:tetratricopeptide (TPR) repeat protein
MIRTLIIAAAIAAAAVTAHAEDYWSSAAEDPDTAIARRNYEREMQNGDNSTLLASSAAIGQRDQKRLLLNALRAYENASLARPAEAEPHYRAGLILRNFFVECAQSTAMCAKGHARPDLSAQMAAHWTAFEKLAPLDPRIDFDFLFDRAIAHTHAAGDGVKREVAEAHIAAALVDYQAALKHTDLTRTNRRNLSGNMAETLMMLGRLDESIELYESTLRLNGDTSTIYGLAVALDRDEQGAKARELVRALGVNELDDFRRKVREGDTFFVPDGEVYYYLALVEEALGDPEEAINDWQHFIDSAAHPRFDARAQANRDALIKAGKHARRGKPPAGAEPRSYDAP